MPSARRCTGSTALRPRGRKSNPPRACDALQLAAAIVASEDNPAALQLVTYDDRLADAALREGFTVVSAR